MAEKPKQNSDPNDDPAVGMPVMMDASNMGAP